LNLKSEKPENLFPFRTEKLNLSAPMVLHRGRVDRRRNLKEILCREMRDFFVDENFVLLLRRKLKKIHFRCNKNQEASSSIK